MDAEAEAPILWPPDAKSLLIGKDPDAGKDWRQEKGVTEDEMVAPCSLSDLTSNNNAIETVARLISWNKDHK